MLTFEQMKELVELVARHRLSGVEVERSGFRLKIDGFQAAVIIDTRECFALIEGLSIAIIITMIGTAKLRVGFEFTG